jgi:hypothetical protein
MPNWVYNSISVTGKQEGIDAFVAKATATHPESFDEATGKVVYTENPEFSFWNFVAPPTEAIESGEYFGTHGWKEGKQVGDTENNWYNFQCDKWGTKWDAGDVSLATSAGEVMISYNTAWSIPTPVIEAMVEQHPDLTFHFWSEEEQGWGAEFQGVDGVLSVTNEWDIPNSHSDYVERDREDSCVCSWSDDPEDLYADCPREEGEFYVVVTRTYKVTATDAEQAWELATGEDGSELVEVEDEVTVVVKDEDGRKLYPIAENGVE